MNANVLLAAIVALFLAGCTRPASLTTPTQTSKLPGTACYMCEELAPQTGPELAWSYILSSYPEQVQHLDERCDATRYTNNWCGGDWIIEDHAVDSERVGRVIVTNTATGFRWEGLVEAYTEPPGGGCCNGLTYQKIVETSVILPTLLVPTPTTLPRSSATATQLVPPTALATLTPRAAPGE